MVTRGQARACPGTFDIVPVSALRTSYAPLRPGRPRGPRRTPLLAPMPLRVVPVGDGAYEVIDGFKRLAAWREEGFELVPVVVEVASDPAEHKRLLLQANVSQRTTTTLDEAVVVESLAADDGLSEAEVARRLGKKRDWVCQRLVMARRLCEHARELLGTEALTPGVARALCSLDKKAQLQVLRTIQADALTARESRRLIVAFGIADPEDRRALLKDPKGTLAPTHPAPSLSADAVRLEAELEQARSALSVLRRLTLPPTLSPPERRRIEAIRRSVLGLLEHLARVLVDGGEPKRLENDDDGRRRQHRAGPPAHRHGVGPPRGGRGGGHPPQAVRLRYPPDRTEGGSIKEEGPLRPPEGRVAERGPRSHGEEQARALQEDHRREG